MSIKEELSNQSAPFNNENEPSHSFDPKELDVGVMYIKPLVVHDMPPQEQIFLRPTKNQVILLEEGDQGYSNGLRAVVCHTIIYKGKLGEDGIAEGHDYFLYTKGGDDEKNFILDNFSLSQGETPILPGMMTNPEAQISPIYSSWQLTDLGDETYFFSFVRPSQQDQ